LTRFSIEKTRAQRVLAEKPSKFRLDELEALDEK
jgi:hypothetical protein